MQRRPIPLKTWFLMILGGFGLASAYVYASGEINRQFVQPAIQWNACAGVEPIREWIQHGQILQVSVNGDAVALQVPMVNAGREAASESPWVSEGVAATKNELGEVVSFEFVPSELLCEAQLGEDLNADRDQTDVFHLGSIVWRSSSGAQKPVTGPWILQPYGKGHSDGASLEPGERLFQWMPGEHHASMQLTLPMFWPMGPDDWSSYQVQTVIPLRNHFP